MALSPRPEINGAEADSAARIERFAKILFIVALLAICAFGIVFVNQPILESHGFRQTQTALTSYYLQQNGFSLRFETPVLGEPWSIPFEFPIYQQIVAIISTLLETPLTVSGRLVSLFFALLTCVPIYLSLARLKIDRAAIYFALALYVFSPVYFFWSATFLIESTALFFTCCYLYFAIRLAQRDWTDLNFLGFSIFLTLALLQKITTPLPTLPVVLLSIVVFAVRRSDIRVNASSLLKMAASVLVPLFVGAIWVVFADSVKAENPLGAYLISERLREWNYGTLQQRLSSELWLDTIAGRHVYSLIGAGFLLAAIRMIRDHQLRLVIVLSLILFLLPFFIFTNLHIVHVYYQTANTVFLCVSIGISVVYVCKAAVVNRPLLVCLVLLSIATPSCIYFVKRYLPLKVWNLAGEFRILPAADFIKSQTPGDGTVIWYGMDYSSVGAFYSERKSLAVPYIGTSFAGWPGLEADVIAHREKYLTKEPSAIALCFNRNYAAIRNAIVRKYANSELQRAGDCDVYVTGR